jgi:hypothetical protein
MFLWQISGTFEEEVGLAKCRFLGPVQIWQSRLSTVSSVGGPAELVFLKFPAPPQEPPVTSTLICNQPSTSPSRLVAWCLEFEFPCLWYAYSSQALRPWDKWRPLLWLSLCLSIYRTKVAEGLMVAAPVLSLSLTCRVTLGTSITIPEPIPHLKREMMFFVLFWFFGGTEVCSTWHLLGRCSIT